MRRRTLCAVQTFVVVWWAPQPHHLLKHTCHCLPCTQIHSAVRKRRLEAQQQGEHEEAVPVPRGNSIPITVQDAPPPQPQPSRCCAG